MPSEPRYNIRAVERLTGVPAPTLRSWERRYGFPAPQRTLTARRLYSDDDVRTIRWVRDQTDHGLAVAQAIAWAQAGGSAHGPAASTPSLSASPEALVQAILAGVSRYDEEAVESALTAAFAQLLADEVLTRVLTPTLVAVGERWARGELPVAAEHFVTNLVRRRLLGLLAAQPAITPRMTAALACLPGEQHDLGLLMLALFLRWAGARVLYLGADLPVRDLVRLAETRAIDAFCLSAGREASSQAFTELRAGLAQLDQPVRVYLGGAAAGDLAPLPGVTVLTCDLRSAATTIVTGKTQPC